ncbi:glycosyltransferase family 39 protein, partial [Candidatus Margulisiibacteriota bacterium]
MLAKKIFEIKTTQGLLLILLFLFTFLAYSNSFTNGFVWVDRSQIVQKGMIMENPGDLARVFTSNLASFKQVSKSGGYYRPMVNLSFTLDHLVWGLNPVGFHISSFLLHLLVVYLIYILILMIFQEKRLAFVAALIFAIHPIHTSAVSWISGRADLLAAFFLLLSFVFYIKNEKAKKLSTYIFALLFFFGSLLSKEIGIVLPLVLLVYGLQIGEKLNLKKIIPFFLVGFVYLIIRKAMLGNIGAGEALFLGDPFSAILTTFHSHAA